MEEINLQSSLLHYKCIISYAALYYQPAGTKDNLALESNDSHAKLLKKVQLNPQQAETINSTL